MLRILSLVVMLAAGGAGHADDAPVPDTAQLRSAREASRAAVDAARDGSQARTLAPPSTGALDAAMGATRSQVTLSEAERQTGVTAGLRDLLERARTGRLVDNGPASSAAAVRPLVFVSLSKPEASLHALLAQAQRADAALVLRGLVEDSMKRTVKRIGELLGVDSANTSANRASAAPKLMIDPTLFERFDVRAVPAFVLPLAAPASCTDTDCPVPPHVKVAGDVSLAHALGVIAREATAPQARAAATRWAARLESAE